MNLVIEKLSACASLDKSGVDEIIFMPRIFSLDFLLNFCVKAKVEKKIGNFTDNHSNFELSLTCPSKYSSFLSNISSLVSLVPFKII